VVKSGNPKHITSWSDLTKPGVGIVTPNPASSGSAKWNLLAAYGSVLADGGSAADADKYMKAFFHNVAALPDSGRDATTAFTGGTGDVLLSYENEAILARQNGADFDYSETLVANSPRDGYTLRPAATTTAVGGATVEIRELDVLVLRGMGFSAVVIPSNKSFVFSVNQP